MKAIVYEKYGSVDQLQLREVEKPVPKENEVLIKIAAASVNSWDWDLLRGRPYIVRLGGFSKPKHPILGADVAGIVEAIGSKVSRFKIGDKVYGDLCNSGWGGFAEYTTAHEKWIEPKPDFMNYQDAAAIPQAATMALQALKDKVKVEKGQKVLIIGAGGGVGSFAIQLAKLFGAEVCGVDHTDKLEFMKSLGTDQVIDYSYQGIDAHGKNYDLVIGVVGNQTLGEYRKVLAPKGKYIMVGGNSSLILQSMFLGPFLSLFSSRKSGILAAKPNKGLDFLEDLYQKKEVIPYIEKTYTLEDVPLAISHLKEGKAKGKLIITVDGQLT